jgi:acyl carrier protein
MAVIALKSLVAGILDVDPATLTEESGMNVTDTWDSVQHLMIMTEIEQETGLRLPFAEVEKATTLGGLRALLLKQGAETSD